MSFPSILRAAITDSAGGARSFPPIYDARVPCYQAPSIAYEKVFFHQASRPCQTTTNYSAGWLISTQRDPCHPVFVAHSLLSAIALVRDTLPSDALHNDGWAQLVSAAVALSSHADLAPPSAQPANSSVPGSLPSTGLRRRRSSSASLPPTSPKRSRLEPATPEPAEDVPQSPTTPEPTKDVPASPVHSSDAEVLPPAAFTSQDRICTVTNNNRRADQQRQKRQQKQQAVATAQHKLSIGLLEPAESAPGEEKNAYRAIKPADEVQIAWIIKQPVDVKGKRDFYQKSTLPYLLACDLLAQARAVGSPSTWHNVAAFLQAWRTNGSPVSEGRAAVMSSQAAVRAYAEDSNSAFQHAWKMSSVCETRAAAVLIEHRWAMAFLGRAYDAKIREEGADTQSHKSEIIDSLWSLVEPTNARATGHETTRKRFVRCLTQASRWYRMADQLGWGSLCLMPDSVTNRWVRECPAHAWSVWLQLVQRVNPEACAASTALDAWIGQKGIQGGAIQGKETLYIEHKGPAGQVEEVADSTDEEDSDIESPTQPVKSPARRLRQLSLLELFQSIP